MEGTTTWGRRARLAFRAFRRFRPDRAWLGGVLRSFVVSFLALTFALVLLPGTQVTRGTESVATLAVALLAVGALLRPLLTRLTVLTGVFGLLVAGLLAQALLLGVALQLVPTVEPFSFSEIVAAAWGSAVAAAAINWFFDASSEESFLGQVLGQSVRLTQRTGTERPGLLVVQLDGVSEPLVRQAMTAGAMPTVAQWLRSGSHDLRRWNTGLPATTPAGQAVLLHGETQAIPAFRWYDKELGRIVKASQPDDAAAVERQFSTGRGLLADGGVSVSNLFSGDAPVRLLTMSDARIPSSDRGTASFVVSRGGFVRAIVLMIGQIITELHQGRRQRRREVVPRVRRSGSFVLLRGLTTVVLRDLNVSLVAEHMARSAPVIFVDFVDYDEVAHHAGPTRPEAMRQLEGLDRVLRFFDDLAEEVRSSYEIVVVSDHGQAQGVTFLQHTGRTLSQVVNALAARPAPPAADDRPEEPWAAANVLAASAVRTPLIGRLARRSKRDHGDAQGAALVVAPSGSLAHLYLTDEAGRVGLDVITQRYPRLIDGLVSEPAIGLVMVRHNGRLRVIGRGGWRDLLDGTLMDGAGDDPMAPYGPRAAADLSQLDGRDHVGDLVLLGRHDPVLDEVVAFEELVGSHGGLGGSADRRVVHPPALVAGAGCAASGTRRSHRAGRPAPRSRLEDLMSGLAVTWWGHSSTTVELGATRIATDPVLSRRLAHLVRQAPAPGPAATEADLVLISHLHGDHLHVPSLRRMSSAPVVIPPGGAAVAGLPAHRRVIEVTPGDHLEIAGLSVEVLPAHHDGRRLPLGRSHPPALGFRVTDGTRSFWYPGDTGPDEQMARVDPVDLALVPIGGWGPTLGDDHLDPEQAATAVAQVGARWAVPVHYGTLWPVGLRHVARANHHRLFVTPAERFVAAMASQHAEAVALEHGRRIELGEDR